MCTTNPNAGLKTDLDQGRKLSQCAQSSLLNQNQNSSNQINLSEGRENINMSQDSEVGQQIVQDENQELSGGHKSKPSTCGSGAQASKKRRQVLLSNSKGFKMEYSNESLARLEEKGQPINQQENQNEVDAEAIIHQVNIQKGITSETPGQQFDRNRVLNVSAQEPTTAHFREANKTATAMSPALFEKAEHLSPKSQNNEPSKKEPGAPAEQKVHSSALRSPTPLIEEGIIANKYQAKISQQMKDQHQVMNIDQIIDQSQGQNSNILDNHENKEEGQNISNQIQNLKNIRKQKHQFTPQPVTGQINSNNLDEYRPSSLTQVEPIFGLPTYQLIQPFNQPINFPIDLQQLQELNQLTELQEQNRNLLLQISQQQERMGERQYESQPSTQSVQFEDNDIEQKLAANLNLNQNRVVNQRELDLILEKTNHQTGFKGGQLGQNRFEAAQKLSPESRSIMQKFESQLIGNKRESYSTRFEEGDLEDWRRNTMTDKLYFLSAASKKSRRLMQQSMPDFKSSIKSKINAGKQNEESENQEIPTQRKSVLIDGKNRDIFARKLENRQALSLFQKNFLPGAQARASTNVNSHRKRYGNSSSNSPIQKHCKILKPKTGGSSQQERLGHRLANKKSRNQREQQDSPTILPDLVPERQPNRPLIQKMNAFRTSNEDPTGLGCQEQGIYSGSQGTRLQTEMSTSEQININTFSAHMRSRSIQRTAPEKPGQPDKASKGKKSNQKQKEEKEEKEESPIAARRTPLSFSQILNRSDNTEVEKKEQTEAVGNENESSISKVTALLNAQLSNDKASVLRNLHKVQMLDEPKVFSGSPRSCYVTQDEEQENENRNANKAYANLFNEGKDGDKKLQAAMAETKQVYKAALRASSSCLKDYQTINEFSNQIITIQPNKKPNPFQVIPCEVVNIIVENTLKRPQPMNIQFSGLKGEAMVLVSTLHKAPAEEGKQYQGKYFSSSICFSTEQPNQEQGGAKDGSCSPTSPMPALKKSARNNSSSHHQHRNQPRFTSNQIYISLETTPWSTAHRQSCEVQVSISFGQSAKQSGNPQEPKSPSISPKLLKKQTKADVEQLDESAIPKLTAGGRAPISARVAQLLEAESKNAVERCQQLRNEVKRVIDEYKGGGGPSAAMPRLDPLKSSRKSEKAAEKSARRRDSSNQREEDKNAVVALAESEASGMLIQNNRIEANVRQAENFAMYELTRKLHLVTRNEERQRASEEKRARNLEELRDGAIQFLHRNDIMREQKRINEERDAEIKRKQKMLITYSALIKLRKIVQDKLWMQLQWEIWRTKYRALRRWACDSIEDFYRAAIDRFRNPEAERYLRGFAEMQQAVILGRGPHGFTDQHFLTPQQFLSKAISKGKKRYDSKRMRLAIRMVGRYSNKIRYACAAAGLFLYHLNAAQSRKMLLGFMRQSDKVFGARDAFIGFSNKLQRIQKNVRRYLAVKRTQFELLRLRFDEELGRISGRLIHLPDGSPFRSLFSLLEGMPDHVKDKVLQDYNLATIKQYDNEFFEWRKKMLKIKDAGLRDRDFGERQPFITNTRIVYNFADVDYDLALCRQLHKCSQFTWTICQEFDQDQSQNKSLKRTEWYPVTAATRLSRSTKKNKAAMMARYKKQATRGAGATRQLGTAGGSHLRGAKEGGGHRGETDEDKAKLKREEAEREFRRRLQLKQMLAAHPERFTTYPDQPRRRYVPIPELLHQLIFKALEEDVGLAKIADMLGLEEDGCGPLPDQQQQSTAKANEAPSSDPAQQSQTNPAAPG